jgi:general secretion pathway protein A
MAHLLYGVQGGGGFVLLTGEIGAGKTTVSRCFLQQVPEGCRVAYVFNPKQTVDELLWTIAQEFGVQAPGQAFAAGAGDRIEGGSKALVDALNRFLLQVHAQGGQAVLVIDEAQALSAEVLEQLRLLTNLETFERKLLQIVLIGQPELRAMVASPGLEQLAQRVIARYHLGPLSAPDTARYVQHRLAVAGLSGPLPFDAAALKRVHERSRGVPRRINLLCDRALLGAYATGRRTVDAGIVGRAAAEVDGEPLPTDVSWWGSAGSLRRTAWLAAAGFVLSLAGAGLASWLMRQA